MRQAFVPALLIVALLAGCGNHVAPMASASTASMMAAQSKHKSPVRTGPGRLDDRSYKAGVAAGDARMKTPVRQGLTPLGAPAAATPNGMDHLSYEYGFVMGELQGALNAYSRINGSYDVYQWKAFAYMNEGAMKDAQATLQNDAVLAAKFGIVLGILTGGIQSFDSINGDFDVNQWQSFSDSNRNVLQNALQSLQASPL